LTPPGITTTRQFVNGLLARAERVIARHPVRWTIGGSILWGTIVGGWAHPSLFDELEVVMYKAGLLIPPPPKVIRELYDPVFAPLLGWPLQVLTRLFSDTWMVCRMLSAMQGAIAFSAVSLWVFAMTRSVWAALLFPGFFAPMALSWPGHNYQMYFLPTAAGGGNIGFYTAILTLGLIAIGKWRTAGFMLGILPLLHPTVALMAWVLAAGVALGRDSATLARNRALFAWWIPGAVLSIVLLALNGLELTPISEHGRRALDHFMAIWCHHRRHLDPSLLIQDALFAVVLLHIWRRIRQVDGNSVWRAWSGSLASFIVVLSAYLLVYA